MAQVLFKYGTRAQYDALTSKLDNALYFLTDTNELYRGSVQMCKPHIYTGIQASGESVDQAAARILNTAVAVDGDFLKLGDQTYIHVGSWIKITPDIFTYESDDKSVELIDGQAFTLKDFGIKYYKYVAAEGTTAAHYEEQYVDDTHPWLTGLEPRVSSDGTLGWYEPNPTTIEGVNAQVTAIAEDLADVQEALNGNGSDEAGLIADVAALKTAVGDEDSGLVSRVADLEDNTYNKTEIDGKLASVFHFRGEVASVEALEEIANPAAGDVYQVGTSEYVYAQSGDNEGEWIELGPSIDLSSYATQAYVDEAIGAPAEGATEATGVYAAISEVASDVSELQTAVDVLETAMDGAVSSITVAGTELTETNGAVSIPAFSDEAAGVVAPLADADVADGTEKSDYVLNAEGNWVDMQSLINAAKIEWMELE